MKLQNKTALVTGASRGIGRAIAQALAAQGAHIAVHYKNNLEAAQETAKLVTEAGSQATLLQADLSRTGEARRLASEAVKALGHVDFLINNAGAAAFKPTEEVSDEEFDAMFNLNVKSLYFLTQEIARQMPEGGRIVNISSGITRINAAGGSVYAASKTAVETFTRSWAAELGPRQITVNTVSPGMTHTDLLAEVTSPEFLEAMKAQTPLGRLGMPEDIADVVVFLCTQEARWLTAQNLLANGGVG